MGMSAAIAAVEELGIVYEVRRHARVGSLEEAAEARGVDPGRLIKTMVVRRDEDDYLLVLVPGDRVISWSRLRRVLGVNRVSMPDAETARRVTGYARGTITPFGTKTPLPVVADERLAGKEVSVGGGEHGVGILLSGDDLVAATEALIGDVTDPM